jgi:hypothetical protein
VDRAKLGQDDRLAALKRLDAEARRLEVAARGPSFEAFAEVERAASRAYGGRTVFDREGDDGRERPSTTTSTSTTTSAKAISTPTARPAQLSLKLDRR